MQYTRNNFTISIDPALDANLSEAGIAIMKDRYLLPEEKSPQECFARSACSFASTQEHAQRLYDYASKCWFMFATPILTNAGTQRGLPISCFLNKVGDSKEGILDHHYENGFLASFGGGVGGDWSSLRSGGTRTSVGNTSTGVIPFIKMMDTEMMAFQQGGARRGSYAAYMDISHPEIVEFIELRTVGGDPNRRCMGQGFHHGINIPDSFMKAVKDGLEWDLKDPHTGEVKKSVDARSLWMSILIKRLERGEPYLHFRTTSNRALPKFLFDKGLRINGTNLCSEIFLPTSEDRTAVCCLSSVNLEFYDDWRDHPPFLFDIALMLDNVLSYFIKTAPKQMWRAVNSAVNERSIGIGTMGYHLYLQKKNIAFETPMALGLNRKIYEHISKVLAKANLLYGQSLGEAPDAVGTGRRFSHMMAIAPNANISIFCNNTSPSVEPFSANAFTQKTMSGSFLIKNRQLDRVLQEVYGKHGEELENIWSSIIVNQGSVQHLRFMTPAHKLIFKTALELDQMYIIEHAAVRQPFICQGQSVNLFLPFNIHKNDLHRIHWAAWSKGLKSLYYVRSTASREVKSISDTMEFKEDECVSCQG